MSEQPTQDPRKLADTVREALAKIPWERGSAGRTVWASRSESERAAGNALDALVALAEQLRIERGEAEVERSRWYERFERERAARESAEREDKRHLEMAAELEGRLESAEAALRAAQAEVALAQARADELAPKIGRLLRWVEMTLPTSLVEGRGNDEYFDLNLRASQVWNVNHAADAVRAVLAASPQAGEEAS